MTLDLVIWSWGGVSLSCHEAEEDLREGLRHDLVAHLATHRDAQQVKGLRYGTARSKARPGAQSAVSVSAALHRHRTPRARGRDFRSEFESTQARHTTAPPFCTLFFLALSAILTLEVSSGRNTRKNARNQIECPPCAIDRMAHRTRQHTAAATPPSPLRIPWPLERMPPFPLHTHPA